MDALIVPRQTWMQIIEASVLFGVITGALMFGIDGFLLREGIQYILLGILMVVLVAALLFACLLPTISGAALFVFAVAMLTVTLSDGLSSVMQSDMSGYLHIPTFSVFTATIIKGLAVGFVAWILVCIARTVRRLVGWHPVLVQDGSYCWWCGYHIGSVNTDSSCPECGRKHSTNNYRWTWFHRPTRAVLTLRPLGSLAGVIVVLAVLWFQFFNQQAIRLRSFANHFRGEGPILPARLIPSSAEHDLSSWKPGLGVWVATPHSANGIFIIIAIHETGEGPWMQVRAATRQLATGGAAEFQELLIMCDLTGSQVDAVLARGLPPDLLDSIRAQSANRLRGAVSAQISRIDPCPFLVGH